LARIWGRAYDFISGPNGEQFHGELFMYVFEDLHTRGLGVDQFQLVQHKSGDLTLKVVQRKPLAPAQLAAIRARVEELIPGTKLSVEQTPDIPRAASGKMRIIVNERLAADG
jgi:hypothetical protein